MGSARFGTTGGAGVTAGDAAIGFVPAVYGPSGRWTAFALVRTALLIYAGILIVVFGARSRLAEAQGWALAGVYALAGLAFLLALVALAHLFTRRVAIDATGIEYSGGLGTATRRLGRNAIAGWRAAVERDSALQDALIEAPSQVVTLYPADPSGKRMILPLNAFTFDEDFDHWLAGLPRIIDRDALRGGDRLEALLHDPLFAPLLAMVCLVYGLIMVLGAMLASGVL